MQYRTQGIHTKLQLQHYRQGSKILLYGMELPPKNMSKYFPMAASPNNSINPSPPWHNALRIMEHGLQDTALARVTHNPESRIRRLSLFTEYYVPKSLVYNCRPMLARSRFLV